MKHLLYILFFIFIAYPVAAQTDSLISGEYTHVEEKGVHFRVNEFGFTEKASWDTSIFISLYLDTNHSAFFSNDTITQPFSIILPDTQIKTLFGQWSIENDTLFIQFNEFWISPRLLTAVDQFPEKQKLSIPIIQKYSFYAIDEDRIKELQLIHEEPNWTLFRTYD